jgi:hypothetical protein
MFDHQLADLWQMRVLESQADQLTFVNARTQVSCRVGILGEPHGGGKTLTMIAHIMTADAFAGSPPGRLHGGTIMEVHVERTFVDTTLIIVPTLLVQQWRNVLHEHAHSISSLCLRDLDMSCVDCILGGEYDVVVLSGTCARRLMNCPRAGSHCFNRVVVDEADSISMPHFVLPHANFLWLITGRPQDIPCAKTALFRRLLDVPDMPNANVWGMQTVRSEESFFIASRPQAAATYANVICKTAPVVTLLAEQGLGDLVDLCDTVRLLRHCGMQTVDNPSGLMEAVSRCLGSMLGLSTDAQVHGATERVRWAMNSGAECEISMAKIQFRTVSTCCFHTFDLASILKAMEHKTECPVCRHPSFTKDQLIVLPEVELRNKADEVCTALFDTINRSAGSKVLIYSNKPTSMTLKAFERRAMMLRVARPSTARDFDLYDSTRVLLVGRRDIQGLSFGAATHVFLMQPCSAEEMTRLQGAVFRLGKAPVVFVNFLREDELTSSHGSH